MNPNENRRTIITIAIVVVVLFFLGWLIWLSAKDAGKVKVTIGVFPSDATLTIDGKAAKPGSVMLTKGDHTLKATRQYFDDGILKINTESIDRDQTVYVFAEANSPEAEAYIASHPTEQALLETARGIEFTTTQESIIARYPIVSELPHQAIDYTVAYSVDEKKNITFEVTLNAVNDPGDSTYKDELIMYKEEALRYLRKSGVDVNKAKITYSPDPDKL